ncbi:hypothetical protein [Geobacter sp. SVR]|uniref:hypothetical protein n=1 Tax=Geobacter sp. SVR TaxID=2495594 RepID=UPI00143F0136|nr:hypothetical protein [Geobacter sp. SVR]BCS54058.1 hypothetical protein GSVR_23660 [Geobacter sp. SVR]GCF87541.1 hypothetical protein GSbR_41410 [Geobacter sp. SVR]
METAITSTRISTVAMKALAVTIIVAAVYWAICMVSPELAKSSVAGLYFGKTLKFANMLRAAILVSPYAVIGTGVGAWMFNLTTGTAGMSAYPILPFVITLIGLGFHRLSMKIGRNTVKDLALLTVFGVITGAIIALNLTSFAVLAGGLSLAALKGPIIFKIVGNTLTVLAGYPLVKVFDRYFTKRE